MTGTLSGYLVYRIQDSIERDTGNRLPYQLLIDALTDALLQLDKDMQNGESIELPSGNYLTRGGIR